MKKTTLKKAFEKALSKQKFVFPIQLGNLQDFAVRIGMGGKAFRALNEIREVLVYHGFNTTAARYDPDRIRSTGELSEHQTEKEIRFSKWLKTCEHIARESTILYVQGNNLRHIERTLHIRNGASRKKIQEGVEKYCIESGWVQPPSTLKHRKPYKKREPIIFPTKIFEIKYVDEENSKICLQNGDRL